MGRARLLLAMRTEHPSPRYSAIDLWDPAEILDAMLEGQFAAVAAVHAARPALERAALGIEERLRSGGRLVYAGAGTSGRLAVQDGAELMPTFGWPPERLVLLMAGGRDALLRAVEGAEDEVEGAAALVRRHEIGERDVLTAVAASGTTPFTVACLREAGARGARGAHHRHRQQPEDADPRRSRPPDLARYRRRGDRRLDPDEGRHRAARRADRAIVPGDDPARPRL